MNLCYIFIIMLFSGIIGGFVNYFSDANKRKDEPTIIRTSWQCVLFGIAATLMVPFFLKLADSNLLNNISMYKDSQKDSATTSGQFQVFSVFNTKDSLGNTIKSDTIKKSNLSKEKATTTNQPANEPYDPAKGYLLWLAYCVIAAAAGTRFIDMLLDKVLTQKQVEALTKENIKKQSENKTLVQEKENLQQKQEKQERKLKEQLPVSEQLQIAAIKQTPNSRTIEAAAPVVEFNINTLPPIIHASDPQKDRFGGKADADNRKLMVTYSPSFIPSFLTLKIAVSSTNNEDLGGDVYLFLHDSFAKSVIILDGKDKQIVSYEIPSYGAFTIGAVCNNGATKLEFDIAKDTSFPQDFRSR